MTYLFSNIYWFLRIFKSALLPHDNTQTPDIIAYLPVDYTTSQMSLCTSLAVYSQVKKLTTGECVPVLGQKKSAAHRRVGVLQTVFWLSGKYTQDLRFAHSLGKLGFESHWNILTQQTVRLRLRVLSLALTLSHFVWLHDFERPHLPTV